MSADNWANCPRCRANRIKAANDADTAASSAYGRVGLEEFEQLRAKAVDLFHKIDNDVTATFREDYEIGGAEDGEVGVDYRGSCNVCNLSLTFKHRHPLV